MSETAEVIVSIVSVIGMILAFLCGSGIAPAETEIIVSEETQNLLLLQGLAIMGITIAIDLIVVGIDTLFR